MIPTGISVLFWTMIGSGATLILVNMIIQNTSTEIVVTQTLNALGAWYTLGLVIYCKKRVGEKINVHHSFKWIVATIAVLMIYAYQVLELKEFGYVLQVAGTVALLLAYLPQIIYLHKVKDATGISRFLFLILGFGLWMITLNMIINGTSTGIIITEFVNIGLILVQAFMTIYYQNKNKNH
ncbi:PQ-loop domain-containing transporter [Viridibacillus arvi]|uniref:PQ-loop domain-containing transporter n=1 Tax=Viridibacillus arvi TaxID=263475 RepID=UPI0034D01A80